MIGAGVTVSRQLSYKNKLRIATNDQLDVRLNYRRLWKWRSRCASPSWATSSVPCWCTTYRRSFVRRRCWNHRHRHVAVVMTINVYSNWMERELSMCRERENERKRLWTTTTTIRGGVRRLVRRDKFAIAACVEHESIDKHRFLIFVLFLIYNKQFMRNIDERNATKAKRQTYTSTGPYRMLFISIR